LLRLLKFLEKPKEYRRFVSRLAREFVNHFAYTPGALTWITAQPADAA